MVFGRVGCGEPIDPGLPALGGKVLIFRYHRSHDRILPHPYRREESVQSNHYRSVRGGMARPSTMRVFDGRGRCVATLVDRTQGPGQLSAIWDGRDAAGHAVSTGVYWGQLTSSGRRTSARAVLLECTRTACVDCTLIWRFERRSVSSGGGPTGVLLAETARTGPGDEVKLGT